MNSKVLLPSFAAALLLVVFTGQSAHAAVFEIAAGNTPALRAALDTANANSEDDVINLAAGATYAIQQADNSTSSNGANGLPVIGSDGGRSVTINGRGAVILAMQNPNAPFRVFQIGVNANATINTLTITGGRFAHPTSAPSGGGAILNDRGILALNDCMLVQNGATNASASALPAGGGAIYNNAGTLRLRGCTFWNNSTGTSPIAPSASRYHGGAIYNVNGSVTAQICTFVGNTATNMGTGGGGPTTISGGAIANVTSGQNVTARLTVSNCTFSGNNASSPPGPMVYGTTIDNSGSGATTVLGSSIFVGTGSILSSLGGAPLTSAGYNLSNGDGQGFLTASTDLINTDPQLRVLSNNGGFTQTCALPVTSPALDRGKRDAIPDLAVTTDQRGNARPYDFSGGTAARSGDSSDIGAFELTPSLIVTTTADRALAAGDVCDGADCTFREAITAANAQPNLDTIAFAPGVTGTINLVERLPIVSADVEIGGPGADLLTLRRDTGGSYRLFLFSDSTNATGLDIAVADLTLANGSAGGSASAGGAIYNDFARLDVGRCVLQGNSAGNGAGIYNFRGTVNVWHSTFAANTVTGFGGAFFNSAAQGPATLNITNSTLANNSAGRGAAVYNNGSTGNAKTTLQNATLAGNTSAFGGIYAEGATANITLRNTILSAPSGSPNFILANSATVTSQGGNLSNDAVGGGPDKAPGGLLNQSGDQRNTDPRLDPAGLQGNGGTTPTIALLSDSPAINAGVATDASGLDQRGYRRAGAVDIGAFEFGGIAPPPPPTPTPTATPPPNRFANISTRLRVETNDNVLIGGFIVTGSMQKRIIVRALGPSLAVGDKLENPTLELYDGSGTLLAANDNWQDAPNRQEIIDSTIPPTNELESAILQNVQLGPHTAIVSGVNGGTGVGLVEVYDLGNNQDSRLANISTRGRVLTADNVMIAGLIATGSHAQKVILRAIGPSLGDVPGRLEDPFLELFDAQGTLLTSNNNWKDTQQADIEATGIPPSNDLESAIVTFLPPAAYTAVVRGVNDTTGVAVVEVYALQ